MNEKFKEYTEKGFEFSILNSGEDFTVTVFKFVPDGWRDGEFWEQQTVIVYDGNNLDHAFAACDLWLEGGE